MAALWLLNLDADLEFAALSAGRAYRPSPQLPALVERARAQGLGLLRPDDRLLGPLSPGGGGAGAGEDPAAEGAWVGRAFCPTPAARLRFQEAGVRTEPWPELAIVQAVNGRSFALAAGLAPAQARVWTDGARLHAWLAALSPGEHWLAKREHGVAGKGQRPLVSGALSGADLAWIDASLRSGALVVEPRRSIREEFALHGWIAPGGRWFLGEPVRNEVRERAFVGARAAGSGELGPAELSALECAAERAAQELLRAGYFGPFGVDAYRWTCAGGGAAFEPCSELNARYTLAWDLGMASRRDLLERLGEHLDEG